MDPWGLETQHVEVTIPLGGLGAWYEHDSSPVWSDLQAARTAAGFRGEPQLYYQTHEDGTVSAWKVMKGEALELLGKVASPSQLEVFRSVIEPIADLAGHRAKEFTQKALDPHGIRYADAADLDDAACFPESVHARADFADETIADLTDAALSEGVDATIHASMGPVVAPAAPRTRLPRFDGPKPRYVVNDAHVPGRGLRHGKTPLPDDAADVYKSAVPGDPTNPTAWFGRNAHGQIYRYSMSNDGTAHFSGIDGVGDGIRSLTNYARERLDGK